MSPQPRNRRTIIVAEPATRAPAPETQQEAGEATGLVECKTRLPIWLHLALQASAARNGRSLSAELMVAAREYVERQAAR